MTKIGRGNAKYWIEAVAEGGEDYYTHPGEKPGEWMGELAAELGLEGEVDRDGYFALLAGKHPLSGEVLLQRPEPRTVIDAAGNARRLEPTLGYDVRFSAPKSVSLLWAIGSPKVRAIIEEAHHEAVREGLAFIERHACFVRRGKGGAVIEPGAGFVSMGFLHRSSRAGDPALHSHIVTANLTRAVSDGRWLSLANPKRESPLLREAKPGGFVYQAVLRGRITARLGLEWQPVVNGYADLAGFERETIDHFSRRRVEIVAELAARGTDSAAAAEVAAYRTRDAKDYEVDPDTQRSEWRSRAAEFDLTEGSIEAMRAAARARDPRPLAPADLTGALADLERTHSHFDRRDLLCALAGRMREGVGSGAELEAAVEALIASPRVVEIHHGEGHLATSYYTTPRLLELEQRVMKSAREGLGAGVGVVDEPTLAAVLARHRYLSDEQVAMVRRLTTGGERIVAVAALPGSGKTTALACAREVWAEAGIPGLGIATARSASGELVDAGIVNATSITAFLIRCEEAAASGALPLPRGAVVVMDESSTTSTEQMAAVVSWVDGCEAKLVEIGDPRQIGAVGPGGLYGRITDEIEPIVLTEIRRQRDPLDRRVVELAHGGRGSDALDLLRTDRRLVIADTAPEALDAVALDWHRSFSAGEDAVMIARRIRDVADLNARARELLRSEGQLGAAEIVVGGERFAAGERVITRVNSPLVSNRERWEVVGVDAAEGHLKLRRLGGDERQVILAPGYLERRTENADPAIQHAYALTTYATEGKTFDTTFAYLDAGVSREDFTVAVSRNAGAVTTYAVAASELLDADLGPATRDVLDPAHDVRAGAERLAAEFAATEVSARKRVEALGTPELAARAEQLRDRVRPEGGAAGPERQLGLLEKRIAEESARLAELADSRQQLLAQRRPDRQQLSLIESTERLTQKQLRRLEAERERAEPEPEVRRAPAASGAERAELAQIEDQLLRRHRRQVSAERLHPSKLIVEAIGPRPKEAARAAMWNEGVDLILGYRQRYRVTSPDLPLGPKPSNARQRQARQQAELRLRRIQQALDRKRELTIDRSVGIGR
ncbi:MAG: MobF family relaxase [Solirubrobacterales bacterium]